MRVRIDLLDISERRQQGPVTTRFAVRAGAITLATVLALVGAWLAYTSHLARLDLQHKEARWKEVEPRVSAVRQMRQRNADAQAFLRELDAWAEVRQATHLVLEQIQRIAPPEAQFLALELRDDVTARRPAAETDPIRPYRQARLRIQGRAAGERSEDTVKRLIEALRGVTVAEQPVFSRVSLINLQTDTRSAANLSTFEIEAQGDERYLRGATEPEARPTP